MKGEKKKKTSPATQPVQSGPQRWKTEEGTSPGEKRLLIYCNLGKEVIDLLILTRRDKGESG